MALLTPKDVQEALVRKGLTVRIQTFQVPTATAQQAADALGTPLGTIVKSLCFLVDQTPVLVLTAGDKLVDDRKLAALFGTSRKKVKIADPETTIRVTGYAPGGVAPVGHRESIAIYVDANLGRFETVYAAAGSANTIFPIPLSTLIEITEGRLVDVTKDQQSSAAD